MKRYSHKMCRRYGVKLCQTAKCPVLRRNYPPGIHGAKGRTHVTEYGMQLAEKQKAKVIYNVSEKQFFLTFEKARKLEGNTGINLLRLLEMRLDNAVYRLGLAATRAQARQLVSHGQFTVNDRKVTIPSYTLKKGNIIAIRGRCAENKYFKNVLTNLSAEKTPGWMNFDSKQRTAKVLHAPAENEVEKAVDTQAIVEFYSRR